MAAATFSASHKTNINAVVGADYAAIRTGAQGRRGPGRAKRGLAQKVPSGDFGFHNNVGTFKSRVNAGAKARTEKELSSARKTFLSGACQSRIVFIDETLRQNASINREWPLACTGMKDLSTCFSGVRSAGLLTQAKPSRNLPGLPVLELRLLHSAQVRRCVTSPWPPTVAGWRSPPSPARPLHMRPRDRWIGCSEPQRATAAKISTQSVTRTRHPATRCRGTGSSCLRPAPQHWQTTRLMTSTSRCGSPD